MELQFGDCHTLIAKLADSSVDLIYTDPPFGVTDKEWDQVLIWSALWPEFWRVLKPTGNVVVHCSGKFTAQVMLSQPSKFRYRWFWYKTTGNKDASTGLYIPKHTNHLQAAHQPLRFIEEICVFNRGNQANYFPQPSQFGAPSKAKELLYYTPRSGDCSRPLELAKFVVQTYTKESDVVLDICMSDGITGVACRDLKRKFIGFDNYKPHFEKAQAQLFGSKDVAVIWKGKYNVYDIAWRNHSNALKHFQVAVTKSRSKADAEKEALQIAQRIKEDPTYVPKRIRSNNVLGLSGIYPKYSKSKGLQLCVSYKPEPSGKMKTTEIVVTENNESAAIQRAVHCHAHVNNCDEQNYDLDNVLLKLQEYKRQKLNQ